MANSLYTEASVTAVIARINQLRRDLVPSWGSMTCAQMLHHCQKTFEIALGDLVISGNPLVRFLFGRHAKKTIHQPGPFTRNLRTFREARIVELHDFETEKIKLITLILRFFENGPKGSDGRVHPFYGALTGAEWDSFQLKHLNHHLEQFGV